MKNTSFNSVFIYFCSPQLFWNWGYSFQNVKSKTNIQHGCTSVWFSSESFILTGVLQLMEIGDIQRKDILDHPENCTLLTTLDEGLFWKWLIYMADFEIIILDLSYCDFVCVCIRFTSVLIYFSETWRKFKEEGENLSKAPQTTICEDGIREVVTFLNPKQTEGLCSP